VSAEPWAATYTATVPTERAARDVADRLADRGHQLVAVRVVDHFTFDPDSWWYGKPSLRPEFSGWWDVFSALADPGDGEDAAVAALARDHGGVAVGPGGGRRSTVLTSFQRIGLVHELTDPRTCSCSARSRSPSRWVRPSLSEVPAYPS
jgi:hypothetical protein